MLSIRLLPAFAFIITVSLSYASALYFRPIFGTPTLKELTLYYGRNREGKCVRFKIPKNETRGGILTYASFRYKNRVPCLPDIKSSFYVSGDEQYKKLLFQAKKEQKEEDEKQKEKDRIRAIKEKAEKMEKEWLRSKEILTLKNKFLVEVQIKKKERERDLVITISEAKRKAEEERLREKETL
ncbi:uncharacterized protein LOC128882355 isoform X2 [Hylaeus volcanicus]|uniref:uncharacterized protein LOC128882355 isoform X2 n=1 Tax=Hylaeus volcanicus TaxID=313075 RepID=UPI0023B860DD|nr:uncharacterized protein LOC128882355 isoform X2 [Hylaeus volcanicus]